MSSQRTGLHVRRGGSKTWQVYDGTYALDGAMFSRRQDAAAFVADELNRRALWRQFLYPATAQPQSREQAEFRTIANGWGYA